MIGLIRRFRLPLAIAACCAASITDARWFPEWPVAPLSIGAVLFVALWGRRVLVFAICAGMAVLWWLALPDEFSAAVPRFTIATRLIVRWTTLLLPCIAVMRVRRTARQQQELADTDPLTGLLNRRAFIESAQRTCDALAAGGRPITLAFFDVDRFKEVNDTQGHDAGDRLLIAFADVLRTSTRKDDVTGRWGGDEFVVLLAGLSSEQAQSVVGRLHTALRGIGPSNSPLRPTLSIGAVSTSSTVPSAIDLIAAADRAMYRAKQAQGDRAVFTSFDDSASDAGSI